MDTVVNQQIKDSNRTQRGIWITVAGILTFITIVMALFINKITSPRVLSEAELLVNGAMVFDQPREMTPFSLVDQSGQMFTDGDFKGHWSVIFFGFTSCPHVCPTTMMVLKDLKASLDPEIAEQTQFVFITVDPARDTPEKIAQYLPNFDSEFIGVTGEFLPLKRLATELNTAFVKVIEDNDVDNYNIDHSGNLVLVNPNGHYQGFIRTPIELGRAKLVLQSIVSSF